MHTPQSRRVREAELASHDHDVYPRRQKVELGEETMTALRLEIRHMVKAAIRDELDEIRARKAAAAE